MLKAYPASQSDLKANPFCGDPELVVSFKAIQRVAPLTRDTERPNHRGRSVCDADAGCVGYSHLPGAPRLPWVSLENQQNKERPPRKLDRTTGRKQNKEPRNVGHTSRHKGQHEREQKAPRCGQGMSKRIWSSESRLFTGLAGSFPHTIGSANQHGTGAPPKDQQTTGFPHQGLYCILVHGTADGQYQRGPILCWNNLPIRTGAMNMLSIPQYSNQGSIFRLLQGRQNGILMATASNHIC